MLSAVAGPLIAVALIAAGLSFHAVVLLSVVPSLVSVACFFSFTRDKDAEPTPAGREARRKVSWKVIPIPFWLFLGAVLVFGLGDFSRTFLIFVAARAAAIVLDSHA